MPGIITMSQGAGAEAVSKENPEKAQRFASELHYVMHFTDQLVGVLGVKGLRFGVVEDRDSQTSFLSGGEGWVGRVSSTRRSLALARTSLTQS
jgi:hypothetical protein